MLEHMKYLLIGIPAVATILFIVGGLVLLVAYFPLIFLVLVVLAIAYIMGRAIVEDFNV